MALFSVINILSSSGNEDKNVQAWGKTSESFLCTSQVYISPKVSEIQTFEKHGSRKVKNTQSVKFLFQIVFYSDQYNGIMKWKEVTMVKC